VNLSDTQPLVSVVIIFLNARKYLEEAVESVRQQTLTAWEIVLVDDGSSDGSRSLAESLAASDPARIRVFQHPGGQNRGTGPSRNLGMQVARGRYLTFLDADDIYEPRRLERPITLLEASPELGVVLNRELYWRSWFTPVDRRVALARLPDELIGPMAPYETVIPPPVLIASTLMTSGASMPAVCSITFRRRDLEDLGAIPDIFVSQYEDQAIIVKLLLNRSAVVIEDCLARYRQHSESLTFRAKETGEYRPGQPHAERRRFVGWILEYLDALGISQPLLARALHQELEMNDHGIAALRAALKRRLRHLALIGANACLSRIAVDRLVGWYLGRQRTRATRRVAQNAAAISRALVEARQ